VVCPAACSEGVCNLRTQTPIIVIVLGQLIASRWIIQSQVGIADTASRGESSHDYGIARTSSKRTDGIVDGAVVGI
jgi:hypothetical protein